MHVTHQFWTRCFSSKSWKNDTYTVSPTQLQEPMFNNWSEIQKPLDHINIPLLWKLLISARNCRFKCQSWVIGSEGIGFFSAGIIRCHVWHRFLTPNFILASLFDAKPSKLYTLHHNLPKFGTKSYSLLTGTNYGQSFSSLLAQFSSS